MDILKSFVMQSKKDQNISYVDQFHLTIILYFGRIIYNYVWIRAYIRLCRYARFGRESSMVMLAIIK